MTPYGIVYKDTAAAFNEGAEIWHKKSDFISKKYFAAALVILSLSVIAVNCIIFYFRTDKDLYSATTVFVTVMEIISLYFILKSGLKKNVKNIFVKNSTDNLKQALLRENDIEFATAYSKSNYFYDEIEMVIEGVNSVNIIIERGNLPICISKSGIIKGEKEKFILILKEKMKDRYIFENAIGGRGI